MSTFNIGDTVGVRCEVKPGPFSHEHLISFAAVNGPISGFVRSSELRKETDGRWLVRAVIKQVCPDKLDVMVNGSFFTTNGLASVNFDAAVAA